MSCSTSDRWLDDHKDRVEHPSRYQDLLVEEED